MALEILLIEDAPTDVILTRTAFKKAGIRNPLQVVEDGEKALDYIFQRGAYADAERPGLILLDLNLPGSVDGHEGLRRIRAEPATAAIPVLVLTTSHEHVDMLKSYELTAQGFVTKPLDVRDLITVVATLEGLGIEIV
jgi:CheY-like chemotaxis protein